MKTYQDRWAHGRLIGRGYRECEQRYLVIKEICQRFERTFTVCDVGANMNYFGIRLTEDFPDCSVMAFECDHFPMREAHLKDSGADRVMLLERRLTLQDLRLLGSFAHFDLVLALSVIHHVTGDRDAWLDALRSIGEAVIVELAGQDSRRAVQRSATSLPNDALVIGYGKSHLASGVTRQIALLSGTA